MKRAALLLVAGIVGASGILLGQTPPVQRPLTFEVAAVKSDPANTVAGWSEDGRKLYVSAGKGVPAQIHQIDVATGERSQLIELTPTDRIGMFLMTPSSVSKNGVEYAYSYVRRLSTLFVVDPLR